MEQMWEKLYKEVMNVINPHEVYNVTATYICKDYLGEIVVDLSEGTEAKFFSLSNIPSNLSSTIRGIVKEFVLRYLELKKQGII